MQFQDVTREGDSEYFNGLLDRFEKIWQDCFQNRSISKSAAFQAFITIDQTSTLIQYFDNEDTLDDDEGEPWKTKQS